MTEPFHDGEREVQERMGVREQLAQVGPNIMRAFMPEQHRTFFAQLPFAVAGVLDADGRPRATVLAGPPGFIGSPDERTLEVHALPASGDPARDRLRTGAPIALLGIEPHTRRRNRANGNVGDVTSEGFVVEVRQSFGNCPKYIQARTPRFVSVPASARVHRATKLDDRSRFIVEHADTFFIASSHPKALEDATSLAHGIDVSHRGGKPGFIRVASSAAGEGVLTVPDFVGNYYFNTLGNLVKDARAGLVFIDFAAGDLLQVAVDVAIEWEGPAVDAFKGAERLLHMSVRDLVRIEACVPLRWQEGEPSPFLAKTGAWR